MATEIAQWRDIDQRGFESGIVSGRKPPGLKGPGAAWPFGPTGRGNPARAAACPQVLQPARPVANHAARPTQLRRLPRFEQAYAAAQTAELEPGDALYIPYMWWHGVQSLAPFNILVNYWWNSLPRSDGPPYTSLMHAILAIASLPAEYRKIWQAHFEHFVFRSEEHTSELQSRQYLVCRLLLVKKTLTVSSLQHRKRVYGDGDSSRRLRTAGQFSNRPLYIHAHAQEIGVCLRQLVDSLRNHLSF